MAVEYENWIQNGKGHAKSTLLGGDGNTAGSVSCVEYCHTDHEVIPSCSGASSCHVDNNELDNDRDVPGDHAQVEGTIDSDRYPCRRSGCHIGGAHDLEM